METSHVDFPFDLKAAPSDEGVFEGYGAAFHNEDLKQDVVLPGAFQRSLKDKPIHQIKMLWQHDHAQPIGKWLSLVEDDKGLRVHGQLLLDLQQARDARVLMREKVLGGLSIGFRADPQKQQFDPDKGIRYLKEIDLWEISPVVFPANSKAKVLRVKEDDDTSFAFDISLAEMKEVCPECAERMEFLHITVFKVREGKQMPAALMQGLCRHVGMAASGFFTRCVGKDFGAFQPGSKEGFCAWLHNQCLGKFPSQHRSITVRDLEQILRDSGYSLKEAKTHASAAWKSLQRDADDEHESTTLLQALRDARALLSDIAKECHDGNG